MTSSFTLYLLSWFLKSTSLGKSNFSTMSTTLEQKQVLVKTLKKAVNSFVYSPSEEKKANLSEAMARLEAA